jgi:hypothetical protein
MSPKTGRPKKENPKNVEIGLRITKGTADKLQKCADILEVSRTEVIEKGIDLVYEGISK